MVKKDIESLINLSEEERLKFDRDDHEDEIIELLEEAEKYYKMNSDRLRLQSEYAKLNYEIYESYMSTHQNAIAISGMYSELRISGKKLSPEMLQKVEDILDSYLIINGLD